MTIEHKFADDAYNFGPIEDGFCVSRKGVIDLVPGMLFANAYQDIKNGTARSAFRSYYTATGLELAKVLAGFCTYTIIDALISKLTK